MNTFLGPLDANGRVPAHQQTRVAAFLISAHGAQARRLAMALPIQLQHGWQAELHAQCCTETEFVSLLARSTSWALDPMLPFLALSWESAWIPRPAEGAADPLQALLIDTASFGHAVNAAIRPAALLPDGAETTDLFAQALHRIELESGRLIQAQIAFLRSAEFSGIRDVVSAAVEWRHAQLRELWAAMLAALELTTCRS